MNMQRHFAGCNPIANKARSIFLIACGLLSGCGTPTPPKYYVAPANEPQAQIASGFPITNDFRNTVYISFNYGHICHYGQYSGSETERLFMIDNKETTPKGYVPIVAGKPIWISYYEQITARSYCSLTGEVTLQPNKKYIVKGGTEFKPGVIPLIGGTRECHFAIVDADNGLPIAMKKIDTPRFCTTTRPPIDKENTD